MNSDGVTRTVIELGETRVWRQVRSVISIVILGIGVLHEVQSDIRIRVRANYLTIMGNCSREVDCSRLITKAICGRSVGACACSIGRRRSIGVWSGRIGVWSCCKGVRTCLIGTRNGCIGVWSGCIGAKCAASRIDAIR